MNEIRLFEGHDVEIIELNGQILFNPNHVANCLDIKNVRDNISRMNNKQVVKLTNSDVSKTDIRKLNNAGENFLTESGVYKLIFKSRKENAERFQDWITDEVLPSIRKTGSYSIKNLDSYMIEDPIARAERWVEEYKEKQRLQILPLIERVQN